MGSVFSSVGNALGSVGGLTNGISKGLTPQNNFHAQGPLDTTALNSQIQQSQGNFQQGQQQQQALAQALLAQSQGQGPNPAQAMLNQQTNQNIQQGTGMIASQKGINPALAARLASEQASSANQAAAAQGATMGAQQQIAAQNNLSGLYGNMANQNLQNISTSGGLANQSSLGVQGINAGTSAQNAAATQNTSSGLLNGIGSAIGFGGKAYGGKIEPQRLAFGGQATPASTPSASQQIANSILSAGGVPYWQSGMNLQFKSSLPNPSSGGGGNPLDALGGGGGPTQMMAGGAGDAGGAAAAGGGSMADLAVLAASMGGKIPPHLHPVAKIYHPDFMNKKTADLKSKGGSVPGKEIVKGNSPKNDIVPTDLSAGEVVIDKDTLKAKGAVGDAARMVAAAIAKKNGTANVSDFKSALKVAIGSRRGK